MKQAGFKFFAIFVFCQVTHESISHLKSSGLSANFGTGDSWWTIFWQETWSIMDVATCTINPIGLKWLYRILRYESTLVFLFLLSSNFAMSKVDFVSIRFFIDCFETRDKGQINNDTTKSKDCLVLCFSRANDQHHQMDNNSTFHFILCST